MKTRRFVLAVLAATLFWLSAAAAWAMSMDCQPSGSLWACEIRHDDGSVEYFFG